MIMLKPEYIYIIKVFIIDVTILIIVAVGTIEEGHH